MQETHRRVALPVAGELGPHLSYPLVVPEEPALRQDVNGGSANRLTNAHCAEQRRRCDRSRIHRSLRTRAQIDECLPTVDDGYLRWQGRMTRQGRRRWRTLVRLSSVGNTMTHGIDGLPAVQKEGGWGERTVRNAGAKALPPSLDSRTYTVAERHNPSSLRSPAVKNNACTRPKIYKTADGPGTQAST